MKTVYLLLMIVAVQLTNAQSKQSGFKDFHLHDSKSKWIANLSSLPSLNEYDKEIHTRYLYNGSCCSTIFSFPVKKIILVFNKADLLVEIKVVLSDTLSDERFDYLMHNVKTSFGEPQTHYNDVIHSATHSEKSWVAGDMRLILSYHYDTELPPANSDWSKPGAWKSGYVVNIVFHDLYDNNKGSKDY